MTIKSDIKKKSLNLYSDNEWSRLKEVVVGRVDYAVFPGWDIINKKTCPSEEWKKICEKIFKPDKYYPQERIRKGKKALDNLINILRKEGVIIHRPNKYDFLKKISTNLWSVNTGFCCASPRDILIMVGNKFILSPSVDRTRYIEWRAYKTLIEKFKRRGIEFKVAKRPSLKDSLYNELSNRKGKFAINNSEPVFDAADFIKAGNDVFVQESNVTNKKGIQLFKKLVGKKYKVHILKNKDKHAMHIDVVFVPIAEKTALINPKCLDLKQLPKVLEKWRLLIPPKPAKKPLKLRGFVHDWIGINVLSIDGKKIIVEKREKNLIKFLRKEGFSPIPCDFADYYCLGGGLHCATLDVKREYPNKVKNKFWGQLIVLDLYNCDRNILRNKSKLKKFSLELCKKIKMKPQGKPNIKRFGKGYYKGYSLMLFIETSSITIHADEFGNRVFIDIFSCKKINSKIAEKFSKDFFKAKNFTIQCIFRQ